MTDQSVTIVIPAFNEEKLIGRTLEAIHDSIPAFSEAGWETEIIVCDNNSSDKTTEIATNLGAQVVFEPENQISRARNKGAAAAKGHWLIFIDADSIPTKELFAATLNSMQDPRLAGGGAPVEMDIDHAFGCKLAKLWNRISQFFDWAAGSYIFIERKIFEELGGFSTELFASEEIELCKRIKKHLKNTEKRFRVLAGPPLVSSGRKLSLYSRSEMNSFFFKTIFKAGRPLKSKKDCLVWYDGRR